MMRQWIGLTLVVGCGLMLAAGDGLAQGDGIELPRPEEVFGDNIHIAVTSVVADDATRSIHYFHDSAWHSITYPEDATTAQGGIVGGRSLLYIDHTVWELDAAHDTLIPFMPECGEMGQEAYRAAIGLSGYSELPLWIYYPDSETQQDFACSLSTGELSPPFPDDLDNLEGGGGYLWSFSGLSPTGEWIILQQVQDEYGIEVALFGFNTTTGDVNDLGKYYRHGNAYFSGWITDTQFMIRTGNMGWDTQYVYTGHVDTPNSVTLADSQYRDSPEFFANPPRLESISDSFQSGEYSVHSPVSPCGLHIYDFETDTHQSYYMGSICTHGIIIPDGDGDRLHLINQPGGSSSVVRFNGETGFRDVLFTGEIESIQTLSPDGRYTVMMLDHTGITDNYPGPWPYDVQPQYDRSQAVLFDITTQTIVYEITDVQRFEESPPTLNWLNSNQLVIQYYGRAGRLLTIANEETSEITLNGIVRYVGSNEEWLLLEHTDATLWYYDIAAATETLLFQAVDTTRYELKYEEAPSGQLMVTLHILSDEEWPRYRSRIKWLVTLPAVGNAP